MIALAAADATNTPVWWLVAATTLLAGVTAALALAAWKALEQLKVARRQLEDVKRDRHVQVFLEMGRRWEGPEMTEALQKEIDYTPDQLVARFELANSRPTRNPVRERRRRQAAKEQVVLLRVPNYFEDAATIERIGGLEAALFDADFAGVAVDEWKAWEPVVRKLQETDPLAYVEFERLAEQAEKDDPGAAPQV